MKIVLSWSLVVKAKSGSEEVYSFHGKVEGDDAAAVGAAVAEGVKSAKDAASKAIGAGAYRTEGSI